MHIRFGHVMFVIIASGLVPARPSGQPPADRRVPTFRVDPDWPKPLPYHWIVGAVAGVAVDRRDHVWIVHRPSTLQPNETRSIWKAAPPVLEFDADWHLALVLGRTRRRIRVAAAGTRDLRRRPGQRLARRRRREGRTDPEIHARWKVPDADRPSGQGDGKQRYRESRRAGQHDHRQHGQ